MLPKTELLKGIENADRISQVLDRTDQAIKTWEVVFTDFLSPPELAEAQTVLAKLTEASAIAWGGYPQAERQRLAIRTYQIVLTVDN
jgi:RNA-binding protein YlmH